MSYVVTHISLEVHVNGNVYTECFREHEPLSHQVAGVLGDRVPFMVVVLLLPPIKAQLSSPMIMVFARVSLSS